VLLLATQMKMKMQMSWTYLPRLPVMEMGLKMRSSRMTVLTWLQAFLALHR